MMMIDGKAEFQGGVAERERTATQAKPLAGRKYGGSAPNFSKRLQHALAHKKPIPVQKGVGLWL
jgi:hypothetical protein